MFNIRRYRPKGVTDLFDEAFDIYKSHFLQIVGTSAVILVPIQVVSIAIITPFIHRVLALATTGGGDADHVIGTLSRFGSAQFTLILFGYFSYMLLCTPIVQLVSHIYLGRDINILQSIQKALQKIIPFVLALIGGILVTLGVVLICCLPGIVFYCVHMEEFAAAFIGLGLFIGGTLMIGPLFRLTPVIFIAMLENITWPIPIIKRSYFLTKKFLWRCIGCATLLLVIYFALFISLSATLDAMLGNLPIDSVPFLTTIREHQILAKNICSSVAALLLAPFAVTLLTTLYYDLRIQVEGFDMQIVADQLGMHSEFAAAYPSVTPPPPPKRQWFWQKKMIKRTAVAP